MAENQSFEMDGDELGKVEIAPEVIEVIASIAASEVAGVAALRGNFTTGVAERLGRRHPGKGVDVDLGEDGITLDVYVLLDYGVSIPEVGRQIQDGICQGLRTMTSLEVNAVHVHVVDVSFSSTPTSESTSE